MRQLVRKEMFARALCRVARGNYGTSGKVTRLDLVVADDPTTQIVVPPSDGADLGFLRETVYRVQSDSVQLAAEPIEKPDIGGATIDLDRLYDGLGVGRWVIVAGQRTDFVVAGETLPGIVDGEVALIAGVEQRPFTDAPGDTRHTAITLATPLAFSYERSTVKIYGNVVEASHGESTVEVVGSGSSRQRFQQFAMRRAPLTYLPSATVDGVTGTQAIRANNILCTQVDSLLNAAPADLAYELATDGTGAATSTFGDGTLHGARVPSGRENIRATYRAGIGAAGNVQAGQISLLVSRPLGVQTVTNPLAADGGADRDGVEQIRANAPLAALSLAPLARLVGLIDYEYFARRFAGIGKASAVKLSDGSFEGVVVTVAGVDDIPLTADGNLVQSLLQAYEKFGDPALPVTILVRELLAIFIQARVAILPAADWDTVVQAIRTRLLNAFSFQRRRFGQSAYLSEAIAVIQAVPGVDWVDVDVFGGISELQLRNTEALAAAVKALQKQVDPGPTASALICADASRPQDAGSRYVPKTAADSPAPRFLPAQIAYLLASVPGTLVLNPV